MFRFCCNVSYNRKSNTTLRSLSPETNARCKIRRHVFVDEIFARRIRHPHEEQTTRFICVFFSSPALPPGGVSPEAEIYQKHYKNATTKFVLPPSLSKSFTDRPRKWDIDQSAAGGRWKPIPYIVLGHCGTSASQQPETEPHECTFHPRHNYLNHEKQSSTHLPSILDTHQCEMFETTHGLLPPSPPHGEDPWSFRNFLVLPSRPQTRH